MRYTTAINSPINSTAPKIAKIMIMELDEVSLSPVLAVDVVIYCMAKEA